MATLAERVRLRRAWHLTEQQAASTFGLTSATARSWEPEPYDDDKGGEPPARRS
ncbi:hypothetical protein [Streptomyces liliifuscus]|uniref:Uncharacterized protein n=1 Tax=Streptomyces liliifuscus TaxID=2797636 RepID=A0A7T7L377_9ACTN|nr:hypothetical protein [Streptomyces liliifuscus]QQM45633.1 hypothetical protein JEQ17_43630 [Streptomyces liliifuscus]